MLILSSNGLSPCLREKLPPVDRAALVVTADPEYREKNYHVPRCQEELQALGASVDLFDLDTQPPELLLDYDIVEFIGGNPFYLLHSIRQHQAAPVLRRLAEEKVLVGWSAAAFVFGPTLELVNRYSPELNSPGLTDLTALTLTQTQVLPHYSGFLTKFEHFEETCRAYETEYHVSVIRLNDGDGVILHKGTRTICRT